MLLIASKQSEIMSKKFIYISLFSLVLLACKKEIMTPNDARFKDMTCIKPDVNKNNQPANPYTNQDNFGSGANAMGGGSNGGVYSGSPADTNSITDPNDDDDETGKITVGGTVGGGGNHSGTDGHGGKTHDPNNNSNQNGN